MKKNLLLIINLLFCFFLFAQENKNYVNIKINTIVNANVNSSEFIFIYDELSDFSMIIGNSDKNNFYFNDEISTKAINEFINMINIKAKEKNVLESIEIIQNSYFFNYADCCLQLKMGKHLIFEILIDEY